MSFVERERSYELGEPVELYRIAYSANTWLYTNGMESVRMGNDTYVPIAIKRGETEENGDAEKANMELRVSRNTPLADLFRITPPSETVSLTIYQYHYGADLVQQDISTIVVWKGRIVNVAWEEDEMVLTSESVFSSLLRVGVTRKYSRQCTHALYGGGCKVNKDDFSVTAIAENQVGTVLRITHNKPDNWFAGGYIVYRNADTNAIERRAISANTANTVTVTAFPLGIKKGQTEVTLYAGCDHRHATCKEKFDNIINYGGQPFIPLQNPFGGSTIY